MVKGINEDYIDKSYYNSLVDDAIETISKYCDFDWFVNEECKTKTVKVPCGDCKYETCFDCPKFDGNECKRGYNLDSYIIQK